MAALHAAAATCGEPLWRNLAAGAEVTLPMPMIQIFGGGAHAGRRVDIQDFLIVERATLRPGEEVGIAIDVAASQFYSSGRYRLAADGVELETEALVELLAGWCLRARDLLGLSRTQ
jgi:enolase